MHALAPGSQSCVWMRAGVLSYRLCSQGFDCDRCLLDAALRGALGSAQPGALLERGALRGTLREDRLYTRGHLWVQPLDGARACRVGLDPFAIALLGGVYGVTWQPSESLCERDEPICRIDLGAGQVTLGAPVRGRIACGNEALHRHPALLALAPYDEGWLVEIAASDTTQLERLASPRAAQRQLAADLRRFRRALTLRLLASLEAEDPSAPHQLREAADLRRILAGDHYFELISAFVH